MTFPLRGDPQQLGLSCHKVQEFWIDTNSYRVDGVDVTQETERY